MPSSFGPTVPFEFAGPNVWQPPQPADAKTAAPSASSPPSVSVASVVAASVVAPSVAVSSVVWVSAAAGESSSSALPRPTRNPASAATKSNPTTASTSAPSAAGPAQLFRLGGTDIEVGR